MRILLFLLSPALGTKFKLLGIAHDQVATKLLLGDIADLANAFHRLYLLMISDRDGKQKFIILTSAQGGSSKIHIKLLASRRRLVVDGDVLLIDTTATMALLTEVAKLRSQSI